MIEKLTVQCPKCEELFEIDSDLATKRMRCGACRHVFRFDTEAAEQAGVLVVAKEVLPDAKARHETVVAKDFECSPIETAMYAHQQGSPGVDAKPSPNAPAKTSWGFRFLFSGIVMVLAYVSWVVFSDSLFDAVPPLAQGSAVEWTGYRRYSFEDGERVTYAYKFKTSFKDRAYDFSGLTSFRKYPRHQVPVLLKKKNRSLGRSGKFDHVERLFYSISGGNDLRLGDRRAWKRPQYSDIGAIELDQFHQPKLSWKEDSLASIPLILLPSSRIGVEDLGRSGQSTWTTKKEFELTYLVGDADSPLTHLRTRVVAGPDMVSTTGSSYDGNPESVGSVRRTVEYVVESDDDRETRVGKVLKVETLYSVDGETFHRANAKGFFIFDKTKRIVTKSVLTGYAEIETKLFKLKLPIDFEYKFQSEEERRAFLKSAKAAIKRSVEKAKPSAPSAVALDKSERADPNLIGKINCKYPLPTSIAISSRGFIYSGNAKSIFLHDVDEQKTKGEVTSSLPIDQYNQLVFVANENCLLSAGNAGVIELWKIGSNGSLKSKFKLAGESGSPILEMAVSQDSKYAVTGCRDGSVQIWDFRTEKLEHQVEGLTKEVLAIHVSDDGLSFMATDGIHLMKCQLGTGQIDKLEKFGSNMIDNASFSPNGEILATGEFKKLSFINTATLKVERFVSQKILSKKPAFLPNGKNVLVGFQDEVQQWDIETGKLIHTFPVKGSGEMVEVSLDGKRFAAVCPYRGTIFIYSLTD